MQGYNHALTGAGIWLLLTTEAKIPSTDIAISHNLLHVDTSTALGGALVTAGAALLADIDHEEATIAHSLPPLTQVMASSVEAISGGHRHGTHSLIGAAVFTFMGWMLSLLTLEVHGKTIALGAGILAMFLIAFAFKGLHITFGRKKSLLGSALGPWIVSAGAAATLTYFLDYKWTWLPLSVALGVVVHCLGDSLTTQGVPWLWPWNPKPPKKLRGTFINLLWQDNGYFRVPILGHTNSIFESIAGLFFALYVVICGASLFPGVVG